MDDLELEQFRQQCKLLHAELLLKDTQELANAYRHLHRSTGELLAADPTCADEDFQLAIRENRVILLRNRAKLRVMLAELADKGVEPELIEELLADMDRKLLQALMGGGGENGQQNKV